MAEGLPAGGAGEGTPPHIPLVRPPRVNLQTVRGREDLGTLQAREDTIPIAAQRSEVQVHL